MLRFTRRRDADDLAAMYGRIFGFRETFATLEEYDRAGRSPNAFVENEQGFWFYTAARGRIEVKEADLENFQHEPMFHFIRAPLRKPDADAIAAARALDKELAEDVFAIKDSPVGYGDRPPKGRDPTRLQSRHCMMVTMLLHAVGERRPLDVYEIGGGFGNLTRIMHELRCVRNWTIFDLDFVQDVQAYFIGKTCPGLEVRRNDYSPEPGVCNLIDMQHRDVFRRELGPADVLFGTHSWSELPWNDFLWYYGALLDKVEYLFYATQVKWPSPELTRRKLRLIEERMRPLHRVVTEKENAEHIVFGRRQP